MSTTFHAEQRRPIRRCGQGRAGLSTPTRVKSIVWNATYLESSILTFIASALLLLGATAKLLHPWFVTAQLLHWQTAAAAVEALVGLWLLAGIQRRWAQRAALTCFGLFACVSFANLLSGKASCGCFGPLQISPLVMLTLDLLMVAAMLLHWPAGTVQAPAKWRIWLVVAIAPIMAIVPLIGRQRVSRIDESGMLTSAARFVVLEPQGWMHRALPLLGHIDIGEALSRGQQTLVLYHHDCPDCLRALPKYASGVD
jgi:hypothetical protein